MKGNELLQFRFSDSVIFFPPLSFAVPSRSPTWASSSLSTSGQCRYMMVTTVSQPCCSRWSTAAPTTPTTTSSTTTTTASSSRCGIASGGPSATPAPSKERVRWMKFWPWRRSPMARSKLVERKWRRMIKGELN